MSNTDATHDGTPPDGSGTSVDQDRDGVWNRVFELFEQVSSFVHAADEDGRSTGADADAGAARSVDAGAVSDADAGAVSGTEASAVSDADPVVDSNAEIEGSLLGFDDDTDLITDEERILRALQQSGRIKQARLVAATDWSKAKVSRLLSDMEEAGQVCRTQIGREKVVSLPDEQFEAAKSSLDRAEDDDTGIAMR